MLYDKEARSLRLRLLAKLAQAKDSTDPAVAAEAQKAEQTAFASVRTEQALGEAAAKLTHYYDLRTRVLKDSKEALDRMLGAGEGAKTSNESFVSFQEQLVLFERAVRDDERVHKTVVDNVDQVIAFFTSLPTVEERWMQDALAKINSALSHLAAEAETRGKSIESRRGFITWVKQLPKDSFIAQWETIKQQLMAFDAGFKREQDAVSALGNEFRNASAWGETMLQRIVTGTLKLSMTTHNAGYNILSSPNVMVGIDTAPSIALFCTFVGVMTALQQFNTLGTVLTHRAA